MSKQIHKTNAMRLLDTKKIKYEAISYEHKKNDPVDGVSVAQSLNEPANKVYKTLVCQANDKEHYVFIIPVDQHLDLKKCAKAAKVKNCEMIPLKDLTKVTGYIRGGCSPLGMKKSFVTFMDESAKNLEDIYVSAGKIGMQLHLNPFDLAKAADIQFADITEK